MCLRDGIILNPKWDVLVGMMIIIYYTQTPKKKNLRRGSLDDRPAWDLQLKRAADRRRKGTFAVVVGGGGASSTPA